MDIEITNPPAPRSGFDGLDDRFMSLRSRLEVLKDVLDCDNVPKELGPAAYVLYETVIELIQWHDDLQSWHGDHEHTPKEVQS